MMKHTSIYLLFFSSSSPNTNTNKNRNALNNNKQNEGATASPLSDSSQPNGEKITQHQKDIIDTVPPLSSPNNNNVEQKNSQNQNQQQPAEQFEPELPQQ